MKKKEVDKERNSEVFIKNNPKPPDVSESSISVAANDISHEESTINKQDLQSSLNSKLSEANMKQKAPLPKIFQETNSEQIQVSGRGSTNQEQTSTKASLLEGPRPLVGDFSMTGTQGFARFGSGATQMFAGSGSGATQTFGGFGSGATQTFAVSGSSAVGIGSDPSQTVAGSGSGATQIPVGFGSGATQTFAGSRSGAAQTFAGFGSGAVSFSGKTAAGTAGQLNRKDLHASVEMDKVSSVNVESTGLPSTSSQSLSSIKFISPKDAEVDSPLVPSSYVQGDNSEDAGLNVKNTAVNLAGKHVHLKETVGTSTPHNFSDRLQSWGQRPLASPGNIESLPSIRSSQVSSKENDILADSAHHKQHPSKENYRTLHQSGMLNSEPNLSKQFGNVMNMPCDLFCFTCFLDMIRCTLGCFLFFLFLIILGFFLLLF